MDVIIHPRVRERMKARGHSESTGKALEIPLKF